MLDAVRRNQAKAPLAVIAYAGDDKTKLAEGKLTLIDNQVDAATGTIHLKATFDNADEPLWPGEFVAARLVLAVRKGAVTVPRDRDAGHPEAYVYVDQARQQRRAAHVEVAAVQDGLAMVARGSRPASISWSTGSTG